MVMRHNEKRAAQQVALMLRQHSVEYGWAFAAEARFGQPQEDDAGVAEALLKYKLTEIQIRNNEYSLLPSGNIQDVSIRHAVAGSPEKSPLRRGQGLRT